MTKLDTNAIEVGGYRYIRDKNGGWKTVSKPTHLVLHPHEKATGFVLLSSYVNNRTVYFGFGAKTLKEKLEVMAHYSGHGMNWLL